MRVLCISTEYPPHGHGGYEQQCRDLCEHLRRQGHRVLVLSGEAPGDGDRRCGALRELPRFPVEPAPVAPHAARREERRAASALGRTLASFRPDVACLWRLGELAMSLPARLAAAGVPTIGMVCDPWMIDGPLRDPWARLWSARPAVAAALARATGRPLPPRFGGAARWLLVSDALRRQLVARGVAVGGSDVVPSGIDLPAFPLVAPRPWSGRLLYAGRISPLKGVDLAIRALARLPPDVTLDAIGGGRPAYERELRQLVRALGVGRRVRFHGAIARARLPRQYAAADALVFPVRWSEPFGLAPLEAMACGTPVIGVAAGGAATLLRDGDSAVVVPADDPAALAAAVDRLRSDPALRARLRTRGRQIAETYPAARSHDAVTAALTQAAGVSDGTAATTASARAARPSRRRPPTGGRADR